MEIKPIKLVQKLLLLPIVFMLVDGCNEEDSPSPDQVNNSPCVVTSAPNFGKTTFDYDPTGMKTRKFEFNNSAVTQTVDANKTFTTYSTSTAVLESTHLFLGGTGNLYDGLPEVVVKQDLVKYNNGSADFDSGRDTLFIFEYDDKQRLSVVNEYYELQEYHVQVAYSRQPYNMELRLAYDDNDNVIRLEQTLVWREGSYSANSPSDSYFVYLEDVITVINVTYDDKPSPFTAMLKYWKFVQGDWGTFFNSHWPSIITPLSKNNPVTIAYEKYQRGPGQPTINITYNYNEQGFPIDGYTYNCK